MLTKLWEEANEFTWYANGLSSRVTRFARDNKRQILSKKTSYIENPDYVILTEFNIIENEFWDQFLYVQFCQKCPLFREYILDMYKSLI